MPSTQRKYADLPWYGALGLLAAIVPLPVVLLWAAIVGPHMSRNKGRSTKRIIGERAFRYGISNLNIPQLQFAFGTSLSLGDGARLLWVGPKRVDRVLFYIHGGCFLLPLTDFELDLFRYVQVESEKKNIHFGVAVLEYTLAPAATFPTPLKQACLAMEYLFKAGLQPGNIQIVGDSAGGNLALQLVSQMLHPRDGLPNIRPSAPIRGLCLSCIEFDGIDTMSRDALCQAGAEILSGFSDDENAFAEPAKAPALWFKGVDEVVERVLITAGAIECMRDDIVQVSEQLKRHHQNVELVVQNGGLHDDMFLDFMVKEKKLGTLTPLVVNWVAAGFT
ncbi:Alpha/Beta hydrolase protein [Mycena sp. CBHHK59/15]|nr:Alpha/Beta hydrolase protein [Mycena sp. CBHHK59/15]